MSRVSVLEIVVSNENITQQIDQLLENIEMDTKSGSLNYLWEIRFFLNSVKRYLGQEYGDLSREIRGEINSLTIDNSADYVNQLDMTTISDRIRYLYVIATESYRYLAKHLEHGIRDRSIASLLTICFHSQLPLMMEYSDPELDVLSNIFNLTFKSGRTNLHCYDCGTVARGVFYSLLREYRKPFQLTAKEIAVLREGYLFHKHENGFQGLDELMGNLRRLQEHTLFIIGLKFGAGKFGHIFIAEKLRVKRRWIVRFYQSALNSYFLMDYLMHMEYLEHPSQGINLDEFEQDMRHLLTVKSWDKECERLFVKWYAFYPQSEIDDTEPIRINSSYITL